MKNRRMKGIIMGLMCACIICGGMQIGYAGSVQNTEPMVTGEVTIVPYTVSIATIAFEKKSSTQAYATVDAISTNLKTPYIKSKITMQESAKGAEQYADTVQISNKTVNDCTIFHTSFFTIASTKDYRIKVELSDVNANGIESTTIYYIKMK